MARHSQLEQVGERHACCVGHSQRVRKSARVLVNVAAGVGPALIRSTTDRHADSSGSGCLSDATETKNPSCRHQTRQDTHPSTPVFTVNSSPNSIHCSACRDYRIGTVMHADEHTCRLFPRWIGGESCSAYLLC